MYRDCRVFQRLWALLPVFEQRKHFVVTLNRLLTDAPHPFVTLGSEDDEDDLDDKNDHGGEECHMEGLEELWEFFLIC